MQHLDSKLERRFRLVHIQPNQILELFITGPLTHTEPYSVNVFNRARLLDVPEDTVVHHVFYNQQTQSFVLVLHNPSFEIVPPNQIPPIVQVEIATILVGPDGKELKK